MRAAEDEARTRRGAKRPRGRVGAAGPFRTTGECHERILALAGGSRPLEGRGGARRAEIGGLLGELDDLEGAACAEAVRAVCRRVGRLLLAHGQGALWRAFYLTEPVLGWHDDYAPGDELRFLDLKAGAWQDDPHAARS